MVEITKEELLRHMREDIELTKRRMKHDESKFRVLQALGITVIICICILFILKVYQGKEIIAGIHLFLVITNFHSIKALKETAARSKQAYKNMIKHMEDTYCEYLGS